MIVLPEFWICFFHLNPHLLQITEENMLTGPLLQADLSSAVAEAIE